MKKLFFVIGIIFLSVALLESAYVGMLYFRAEGHVGGEKIFRVKSGDLQTYFAKEIEVGNLKLSRIQADPIASMEHHRYKQFYEGLEVFGGEIIQHYRDGEIVGINGEYYEISDLDTTPVITKEEAVEIFRYDLMEEDLQEVVEDSGLIIYPVTDGDYHLAHIVVLERGTGYSMTGIIDAINGDVLLKYSNIQFDELAIGLGVGYHGEQYKLSTTHYQGSYYLADENKIRPVNQYTINWNLGGEYLAWDEDNYWDHDGALVNAHVFLGLTYDYYYLSHGRNGIDDKNMNIIAHIHWYDGNDNAFWNTKKKEMYFLDPGAGNLQLAAAIDTVAHEYSHGVTQYSSNLVYSFQSGALNESFSDIMGTAVEHYWQPRGNGLLKADWYCGEDMSPNFRTRGCRNMANPNTNSQLKNAGAPSYLWYPDPCHLSQQIPVLYDSQGYIIDNGGVHLNSTIYAHAYYLLAEGGTNKVSGKSVDGIGIEKATKIFYGAWIHYLIQRATFWHAASALGQAAWNIYGASSNEYAQTIKAMEAIGWIYQ